MDTVTHDMMVPAGTIGPPPIASGAGVVLIENQPAAHMGCSVLCSGAASLGPAHPPPPVVPLVLAGAATVFINGQPAARWNPAPDFSACGAFLGDPKLVPTRTVFIGGVSSLVVAIGNLQTMLRVKLDDLSRWDTQAQAEFRRWFGRADESSRQKIVIRIERSLKLLERYGESNFRGAGEDNEADLYAFVHPKDDQQVYLGNRWATSPLSGPDSQASTLGHEISHFKSIDSTDDHAYGPRDSSDLAKEHPAKAIDNADNFLYYLENAPQPG